MQMITINMGIKRTHLEYQDHIKVIRHRTWESKSNRKVMGRWYNGVPMDIPNYGGDYHFGVGSKYGDFQAMQYFSYPVFVS